MKSECTKIHSMPHDATDYGLSQVYDRRVKVQCTYCVLNIADTHNFKLQYILSCSQKAPIYLVTLHKRPPLIKPTASQFVTFPPSLDACRQDATESTAAATSC
jgi:hypothetical protein